MQDRTDQIAALLTPTVVAMGYELWGCEFVPQGRLGVLRVYIDGPNGVDLEACEQVSRQISAVLDVEDLISRRYALEVSSPGLDRTLFCVAHYELYQQQFVKLRLRSSVDGQQQFLGNISDVVGEDIIIEVEGQLHTIPFELIKRGTLLKSRELLGVPRAKEKNANPSKKTKKDAHKTVGAKIKSKDSKTESKIKSKTESQQVKKKIVQKKENEGQR